MWGVSDVTGVTVPEARNGVVRVFPEMRTVLLPLCGKLPPFRRENIVPWGNEWLQRRAVVGGQARQQLLEALLEHLHGGDPVLPVVLARREDHLAQRLGDRGEDLVAGLGDRGFPRREREGWIVIAAVVEILRFGLEQCFEELGCPARPAAAGVALVHGPVAVVVDGVAALRSAGVDVLDRKSVV